MQWRDDCDGQSNDVKKVDSNHAEIVKALRSYPDVSVFSIATLGQGIPDLVVGINGVTVLVEVKAGRKKLNALQASWHAAWTGTPVVVMRSVDEAHALVQDIRMARRVFGESPSRAEDDQNDNCTHAH
tara:strand:- start:109 stop:492 length:384 start_codon:yes stop_codon:yes gene_type:complete